MSGLIDHHYDGTKWKTEMVELVHLSARNLVLHSLWNWGSGTPRVMLWDNAGSIRMARQTQTPTLTHTFTFGSAYSRMTQTPDLRGFPANICSSCPPPHLLSLLLLNEAPRWLLARVREGWGRNSGVRELFAFPAAEASPDWDTSRIRDLKN